MIFTVEEHITADALVRLVVEDPEMKEELSAAISAAGYIQANFVTGTGMIEYKAEADMLRHQENLFSKLLPDEIRKFRDELPGKVTAKVKIYASEKLRAIFAKEIARETDRALAAIDKERKKEDLS